jgi:hypothetical protein
MPSLCVASHNTSLKMKLQQTLLRAPTDEGETRNLEHHAHSFGNSSFSCNLDIRKNKKNFT